MRKSHLTLLLALALCLGGCAAEESDWKLDTAALRAEQVDGETWYDLGDDLLARRRDPADENSSVYVLIGDSRGLPAGIDFEPEATKALSSVSDEIFEKICDRGRHKLPNPNVGTFKRPNAHFRDYRTRSGRMARVEIELASGLAEVSIR